MGQSNWQALAVVALAAVTTGCKPNAPFEYEAFDLAPPQEELTEFSLGTYSIPIPIAEDADATVTRHRTRFQLNFHLHALVLPENESTIADSWTRHEGKIRDHVIRVCRNASVDELREPELSILKARLMDALAAQMDKLDVRQLLITDVVSQPL
jgi:flagellar basal body-associated protein FliL